MQVKNFLAELAPNLVKVVADALGSSWKEPCSTKEEEARRRPGTLKVVISGVVHMQRTRSRTLERNKSGNERH